MLRILIGISLIFVFLIGVRFALLAARSTAPASLGVADGRLEDCGSRPNCVSSLDLRERYRVAPIALAAVPEARTAIKRAQEVIAAMSGGHVIRSTDDYLHAEFRSRVFRFIDDLEVFYNPATATFDVRSASRVGHSDIGANRRRVEDLRRRLGDPEN